jgi:sugar/nucleoside kinase (ribokinase family)
MNLDTADIFHFGDPQLMRSIYRGDGAELVSILMRARRAGATTSVELSLPDPTSPAGEIDWPLILANSLPLVDLAVSDADALLFMLKPEIYDRMWEDAPALLLDTITPELLLELSEMVLGYGVKAVMINLGQRGNYLRTNGSAVWRKGGRGLAELSEKWYHRELWAPAFEIEAQETAGGGTGAIAGFLSSIAKGADPETALVMASAVGACCMKSAGNKGRLNTWEETLARVNQGWDQLPLNPVAAGWRKEGQYGIWVKE